MDYPQAISPPPVSCPRAVHGLSRDGPSTARELSTGRPWAVREYFLFFSWEFP